jgi:hypothetical protein
MEDTNCTNDSHLTVDRLREVLAYDIKTGAFTWLVSSATKKVGSVAGGVKKTGYRFIQIDGRQYREHRLAWLYVNEAWPKNHIDHIDGNRANNKISNLRDVDDSTNSQNQRASQCSNKSTGILGVCFHKTKKKFHAQIKRHGKRIHLGYFDNAQDAHNAYLAAKRQLHAGCTI